MPRKTYTITALRIDVQDLMDGSTNCAWVEYTFTEKSKKAVIDSIKECIKSDGKEWGEKYKTVEANGVKKKVAKLTEADVHDCAKFEVYGYGRHFKYQVFEK